MEMHAIWINLFHQVRFTLLIITLYFSIILILLMTMFSPAHASSAVSAEWNAGTAGCFTSFQTAMEAACADNNPDSTSIPGYVYYRDSCVITSIPNFTVYAHRVTLATGVSLSFTYTSSLAQCDCPIPPLPKIPKDDLCSQSLDQGSGVDVNNACTSSLDDRWNKPNGGQMQCLAGKINKLPLVPHFTKPSATIRTAAYQNHLLNVFNKLEEIKRKDLSAAQKQACASIIADVNDHSNRHGIVSKPSASDDKAPHVLGKAIDIPEAIANALIAKVTQYGTVTLLPNCPYCIPITTITSDVENYVQSATTNPPACNMRWGGRFDPIDNVHFQLP